MPHAPFGPDLLEFEDSGPFGTYDAMSYDGTRLAEGRVDSLICRCAMWNWIRCYVTGHDYSISCEGGSIFLRCLVCARRSQGWVVCAKPSHTHGTRV